MTLDERRTIGVFPPRAYDERRRLFDVLERAFDVTFEARAAGQVGGLDGALVVGDDAGLVSELGGAGVRCMVVPAGGAERSDPVDVPVTFLTSPDVDARLRGRTLVESAQPPLTPLPPHPGMVPLATGSGGALWGLQQQGPIRVHRAAAAPAELAKGERLEDHLGAGRFLPLLALVQFLREVTEETEWSGPGPRACLIIDDPNLHWPSYGYVRYADLAAHATEHGYHMNIAMVPMDAAYAHPAAVEIFRTSSAMSLSIHGNNHSKDELAQPLSPDEAIALVTQALRRVEAFEQRHSLEVGRVMIPPHGSATVDVMKALLTTGFEGICFEGPVGDRSDDELLGWHPADVHMAGALPGLHRDVFTCEPDGFVLRSFLDQPIILAGHHGDLASSLEVLAHTSAAVNQLDGVRWMSLSDIARSSYRVRRRGSVLQIQPFTRLLDVEVPDGVTHVVVQPPTAWEGRADDVLTSLGAHIPAPLVHGTVGEAIPVAGAAELRIRIPSAHAVGDRPVSPPPWRAWPVVRRCLASGRDRMMPVLRRFVIAAVLATPTTAVADRGSDALSAPDAEGRSAASAPLLHRKPAA